MSGFSATFALLLLLLVPAAAAGSAPAKKDVEAVEMVREGMRQAMAWAEGFKAVMSGPGLESARFEDCAVLYGDAESRLARLVETEEWGHDDAVTWLSAALASQGTCLDGLEETGRASFEARQARNLTSSIREALAAYRAKGKRGKGKGISSFLMLRI